MKSLKGLFQLTRPVNAFICGLSVFCGAILGGNPFTRTTEFLALFSFQTSLHINMWQVRTLSGVLSASLILAAGNVFNDVRDLKTDRINTPHRPIPSGMVSLPAAMMFALVLAVSGLILSLPLGLWGIAVALFAVVTLAAYDILLKGVPLAGNTAVAGLAGLTFIYGGIAGHAVERSVLPAVFAFLFHLGRELLKDAADMEGDRSADIKTAATVWGKEPSCRTAAALLMALAVITISPFTFGYFGFGYFVIIALGVWPVLIYSSVSALRNPSENNLRMISTILKIDMPVGIVAVIVGFM
ncbi:geranylgeranylglycerol-phosphate geranylgeranyltransferase [Candidatus Latescibacterota bacterium]